MIRAAQYDLGMLASLLLHVAALNFKQALGGLYRSVFCISSDREDVYCIVQLRQVNLRVGRDLSQCLYIYCTWYSESPEFELVAILPLR